MRILRVIVAVLTVLAMAGRYFQERRRLAIIARLPGDRAQAYYESTRQAADRVLVILTALFGSAALAAAGYFAHFVSRK